MPNAATRPLFEQAAKYGIGLSFGYAELTPDGHHFNTSILVDREENWPASIARCICRATRNSIPSARFQHLEKRYFEAGDMGFPVWRYHGRHSRHAHLQ